MKNAAYQRKLKPCGGNAKYDVALNDMAATINTGTTRKRQVIAVMPIVAHQRQLAGGRAKRRALTGGAPTNASASCSEAAPSRRAVSASSTLGAGGTTTGSFSRLEPRPKASTSKSRTNSTTTMTTTATRITESAEPKPQFTSSSIC